MIARSHIDNEKLCGGFALLGDENIFMPQFSPACCVYMREVPEGRKIGDDT